jgi:hypothetical protein
MIRPRLMSSCSTGWRIHRWFHLVAQRADVKLAGVKRTDLKRAEVKRTDVKRTYAQLADVKGMGVPGATEKGTHVIVPNYYPRPPGRGALILAKRDGYCLGFYCGCSFGFTFYGLGDVACVQNWSELDSHAIDFPIPVRWNSME